MNQPQPLTALPSIGAKQAESRKLQSQLAEFLARGGQVATAQNTGSLVAFNEGQTQEKVERRIAVIKQRARQIDRDTVASHLRIPIVRALVGSARMSIYEIAETSGLTKNVVEYNMQKMRRSGLVEVVGKFGKTKYYALTNAALEAV